MNILIAHDGSEQADKALKRAAEIATGSKASLSILSVVPDLCMMELSDDDCKKMYEVMTAESQKKLEAVKARLSQEGVNVDIEVRFGNAVETILDACTEKKIDMVVVGSHGRHGAKKFLLGSVSSKIVRHAPCEVLVVK
ncbi:MAG: universal stress protein [Thermoleophilia bacterium]